LGERINRVYSSQLTVLRKSREGLTTEGTEGPQRERRIEIRGFTTEDTESTEKRCGKKRRRKKRRRGPGMSDRKSPP